jgi:hypothetical protein
MATVLQRGCVEDITPAKREVSITASCKIRVEDFSTLGEKRGDCITSPVFGLCGWLWRLKIYPFGAVDSESGSISIFLENYLYEAVAVKLGMNLCSLEKPGNSVVLSTVVTQMLAAKYCRGWRHFVSRDLALSKDRALLENDTATFEVKVTTLQPSDSKLSLCAYMRDCLLPKERSGREFQFKFKSAKDNLWAHEAVVMAQSSVLRDLLSNRHMSAKPVIAVHDVEPSVMRELLMYMYTDGFSNPDLLKDWDWARKMFIAASIYGVAGARTECELSLCELVSVGNVYSLLSAADSHAGKELKKKCVDFALVNCPEVFHQAQYSNHSLDNASGSKTKKQRTDSV